MDRPSVVVSVLRNVDAIKVAVSVDIQIRYLRIRGEKRAVLVEEHAIGTAGDIGGNRKAEIVLRIQRQTV